MFDENKLNKYMRRGSLTPSIAILLVLVIALGAILTDYSRLAYAKPLIEHNITRSIDVALMDYEPKLYQEFRLYALNDATLAERKIKGALDLIAESDNLSINSYQLNNIKLHFTDDNLTKPSVLKQMIVENHSKEFITGKAVNWFERLESFKHLNKLTASMTKFSVLLEKTYQLDRIFKTVNESYKTLKSFENLLENSDIEVLVNNFLSSRAEYQQARSELAALKEEYQYREKDEEYRKQLAELQKVVKQTKENYYNDKLNLEDLLDAGQAIEDYLSDLEDFSSQLASTLRTAEELRVEINMYSSEKLDSYTADAITKISGQAEKIISSLSSANQIFTDNIGQMKSIAAKYNSFASKINALFRGAESFHYQTSELVDKLKRVELIEIAFLEQKEGNGNNYFIKQLTDYLFLDMAKIFDYDYGEIPFAVYGALPSSGNGDYYQQFQHSSGKFARLSYAKFSDDSKQLNNVINRIEELGDNLVQKLIITDYIMTHFSAQTIPARKGQNQYLKGGECEYILFGNRQGAKNVIATEGSIFAIRLVLNGLSIFAFKHVELEELSVALAVGTGYFSYPVWLGIVLIAWSGAESYVDLISLKKGGTAKLFKFATDIRVSLTSEALNAVEDILPSELKFKGVDILDFSYSDYLFLLLLAKDEKKTLLRVADLLTTSKALKDKNFRELKTNLILDVEAVVIPLYSTFRFDTNLPIISKKMLNYHFERGY